MEQSGNPETSVSNHLTPRNNPEDGIIQFPQKYSVQEVPPEIQWELRKCCLFLEQHVIRNFCFQSRTAKTNSSNIPRYITQQYISQETGVGPLFVWKSTKYYDTEILLTKLNFRSSIIWDVMQRRLVVSYWRFETTYGSHLEGSERWERQLYPERR